MRKLIASPSPAQAPRFTDPSPNSAAELIPALDESIGKAKQALGGMDDASSRSDTHWPAAMAHFPDLTGCFHRFRRLLRSAVADGSGSSSDE